MHGTAELQVAAETQCHVLQAAAVALDGQDIRQCLGRMEMSAVAGIDEGHCGVHGGHHRRALLGMPHGDDVRIVGNRCNGVGYRLTLGGRGIGCTGKAQALSAQLQHGRLKGKAGPGRGLKEEGCQLLVGASVPVLLRMRLDVIGHIHQMIDLFHREIQNVDDRSCLVLHDPVSSLSAYPIQLSSEGLSRKRRIRASSSGLM